MARLAAAGKPLAGEQDFLAVQDPAWADLARSRSATSAGPSSSGWASWPPEA